MKVRYRTRALADLDSISPVLRSPVSRDLRAPKLVGSPEALLDDATRLAAH